MDTIKEVKLSGDKIYISPHEGFTLSFMNGNEKKKYKFENGRLLVNNPADIALLDAEYDRRYLVKDLNGDPVLDENGHKQYAGEMKFVPIDEYEKRRLMQPVIVKTKSGKTYQVTEGDLVNLAENKEAGIAAGPIQYTIGKEEIKQTILNVLEEQGVDADQEVVEALSIGILNLLSIEPAAPVTKSKPKGKK